MIVSETSGGSDFQLLEAGSYAAVCSQIIGLGPQETPWGNQEKIKMRFEVPSERVEFERDGEKINAPAIIWATYTSSLSSKANLRHDLESWRGRPFTAEELKGFDLDNILGKPCMISVIHREGKNGRTYANIAGISKLPKGMDAPEPEGDLVSFDPRKHSEAQFDALPEWLQALVTAGKELMKETTQTTETPPDFQDDDIPF